MTLRISRVNQPRIITDELFPELQRYGEISKNDFQELLEKNRQKSYLDHYQNLGKALSIFSTENSAIVYQPDAFEVPKSEDRLAYLLFQFPYFRRYLRAACEGSRLGKYDVLTPEEQDKQFIRKWRHKMLSNWEEEVLPRIDDLEQFIESNSKVPVQVKDYFFTSDNLSDQKNGERMLLLALLVAGEGVSSGINIDMISDHFKATTPNVILDKVLTSIGCETVQRSEAVLLDVPVTFEITKTQLLADAFEAVFDEPLRGIDGGMDTITSALQSQTPEHVFEVVEWADQESSLRLSGSADTSSPTEIATMGLNEATEYAMSCESPSYYGVELVPALWRHDFQGTLKSNLLHLMEQPAEGRSRKSDLWPINVLFREREYVSSCAPLFSPSGKSHSAVGRKVHSNEDGDLFPFIQLLTYIHNFPVRFLVTAGASGTFSVKKQNNTWILRRGKKKFELIEAMERVCPTQLVYPSELDQSTIAYNFTKFCRQLELIKVDQVRSEVDITSSFRETISANNCLDINDRMESIMVGDIN